MSDRHRVTTGFLWSYAERISAQAVSFLVSIILARLIAPEEYGIIALITIFITISNVFVTGGYGNSLVQKQNADELDFSTIFHFSLLISFVFYLLIYFVSPAIGNFYEMPQLVLVMRVMALRLPIAAINSIQHAYVQKKMIFRKFFFSTLIGTVISAIIGITTAYMGFGYWALVGQYLSNTLIDTVVLFIITDWYPKFIFSFSRLKKLFSFGSKVLLSRLIDTLYIESRSLIIGKSFGSSNLAYYNRGKQFPDIIVTNIDSSINKVLFPAMANIQDNLVRVKQVTRRSIKVSTFIMSPLLIGLAVVSPALVEVLLTTKWMPIVPFLQIFCVMYIFRPLNTSNMQAIQAIGRADIYLKLEVIKKTYGLIVLLISIFAFNSVKAIAIGHAITSITSSFINAYPNKKLLNYGYMEQLRDITPNIFLGLVMGIFVYTVSIININVLITLFLQIAIGCIVYVSFSILAKVDSYDYLKEIIYTLRKHKKNNF